MCHHVPLQNSDLGAPGRTQNCPGLRVNRWQSVTSHEYHEYRDNHTSRHPKLSHSEVLYTWVVFHTERSQWATSIFIRSQCRTHSSAEGLMQPTTGRQPGQGNLRKPNDESEETPMSEKRSEVRNDTDVFSEPNQSAQCHWCNRRCSWRSRE